MPSITARAIVLRAAEYKDYDRILTLFTLGKGAVTAAARYCRRIKSPLLNAAVPFVAGEFVLTERQGRYTIASCTVEDAHYSLRDDPERLACATYICSLCEEVVQPGQPADELFALCLRALAHLCYAKSSPYAATLCFLMRLLDEQGVGPILARCSRCSKPLGARAAFDAQGSGALCLACAQGMQSVSTEALLEADALRSGPFDPPERVGVEAFDLLCAYAVAHFERSFKALSFLKKMQNI